MKRGLVYDILTSYDDVLTSYDDVLTSYDVTGCYNGIPWSVCRSIMAKGLWGEGTLQRVSREVHQRSGVFIALRGCPEKNPKLQPEASLTGLEITGKKYLSIGNVTKIFTFPPQFQPF